MRGSQQRPVEPIRPGMIRTGDAAAGERTFRRLAQACAAMPAHVVKSAHIARGVARNNDAFPGQLAQEVVARIGDGAVAPGADPPAEVKALDLLAKDFRICVIPRRQGHRKRGCAHTLPIIDEVYKGRSGMAIDLHMCATGLPSKPSPSLGCLKLRPMISVNCSSVGFTPGSKAYRSFTVTRRGSMYHLWARTIL